MKYAYCAVPAAPLRKRASHRAEMVNQLLYGETVIVEETRGKWLFVKGRLDGYTGWVTASQVRRTDRKPAGFDAFVTTSLLTVIRRADGSLLQLPMGSFYPDYDQKRKNFSDGAELVSGQVLERSHSGFDAKQIIAYAEQLLHAPYLWGGKTILGVDCSGFVQTVFRLMNTDLPRDAWQQAQKGKKVTALNKAKAGDLAFFDDKDEIVHVGIVIDANTIIHASGQVRVDALTPEGIVHSGTGQLTHRLKLIKRIG